ncbi:hypothetical protein F1599_11410 [Cupriavidus cauae]|uniref:Uncharacterized protein n=1 Tax=Cupriavidus cauae TaxID=2608999 RepID=A0A5M8AS54_9BURK|nr:hypothetical protein F1599_11410 [Cupriavidus cauae]
MEKIKARRRSLRAVEVPAVGYPAVRNPSIRPGHPTGSTKCAILPKNLRRRRCGGCGGNGLCGVCAVCGGGGGCGGRHAGLRGASHSRG